jgi:hypothetical protein
MVVFSTVIAAPETAEAAGLGEAPRQGLAPVVRSD